MLAPSSLARWVGLVGATALLLGACASRADRFGQVLVFGKAKDAVKLDPADVTEGESSAVTQNLFDTLVRFKNGTTELEPGLAKSWTISPDGTTYRFALREGVRFHDGTPLDAAAVALNFARQADAKHPLHRGTFEYWLSFFEPVVASCRATGPLSLEVKLKAADATFLANLALYSNGVVSPKALEAGKGDVVRHPVGTGAFSFLTWVPGQKIVLKAFAEHWDGKPKLDHLAFKPIPENAVRLLELEQGEIHGMTGLNPDDAERVAKHPDLVLRTAPGMNVGYLALNMTKPPFNDLRLRRAVALSLNTPAMVQAFFAGGRLGRVASNPIPPTVWGHHDEMGPFPLDPTEVKRLLADAGHPNGFDMELWALPVARAYMPDGRKVAEAIQADLAKAGIRATIKTYEWGTYLDKLGKGEHQAALIGWNGDNGDPDNFLGTILHPKNARVGSASNYSFYTNPQVGAWLDQARATPDRKARTALYRQIQEVVRYEVPLVPLFHGDQVIALRREVLDFTLQPMNDLIFHPVGLAKDQAQAARSPWTWAQGPEGCAALAQRRRGAGWVAATQAAEGLGGAGWQGAGALGAGPRGAGPLGGQALSHGVGPWRLAEAQAPDWALPQEVGP